jgi:hypothetical protein
MNVDELLVGSDLVLDCVDNAPTRQLIQDWCTAHRVPCLHGGLAANGEFGIVAWDVDFPIESAAEGEDVVPTCHEGDFLPFIQLVSAQMALAAQLFLDTDVKNVFRTTGRGVRVG